MKDPYEGYEVGKDGKMISLERPKSKYEAANAKLLKSMKDPYEGYEVGKDGELITGEKLKGYKKGGLVTRADGAAKRGKTKGRTI
jgi:hypothetical protein